MKRLFPTSWNGSPRPTGESLKEAITSVDAATDSAYYMINCAHPTHFDSMLATSEPWVKRLHGIRANASRRSQCELNEAPDLDDGDPVELGAHYGELCASTRGSTGSEACCGTDHRHIEHIARACKAVV